VARRAGKLAAHLGGGEAEDAGGDEVLRDLGEADEGEGDGAGGEVGDGRAGVLAVQDPGEGLEGVGEEERVAVLGG
jgi:hypothetical protein